jgi:hypothetical protein
MATPHFTANRITRHSFDNDSSIDIVGERLGLLRGTAAELARPGQIFTPLTALSAADTDAES